MAKIVRKPIQTLVRKFPPVKKVAPRDAVVEPSDYYQEPSSPPYQDAPPPRHPYPGEPVKAKPVLRVSRDGVVLTENVKVSSDGVVTAKGK